MARQALPPLVIALVVLGILGSGVFIYFQMSKDLPSPQPIASSGNSPDFDEEVEEPVEPEFHLPDLDTSDEVIRTLIEQISEHPQLARWTLNDGLVRRFVAAVENGGSPVFKAQQARRSKVGAQ